MHIAADDAHFFQHFAADGFFQRFPGFEEAGQRRIHVPTRKPRRMPQNRSVAIMHQHDHGRIGAREVLRVALGALHDVAGRFRLAGTAADAAELMPGAPV